MNKIFIKCLHFCILVYKLISHAYYYYKLNTIETLTCEQFPLSSSNEVSFDDQQHCSMFNQNACGQIPNFRSDIHDVPMSIIAATVPVTSPTNSTQSQPDHAS